MTIIAISNVNSIEFFLKDELIFKCKLINDITEFPKYKLIKKDIIYSIIKTEYKFPFKINYKLEIGNEIVNFNSIGGVFKPYYSLEYDNDIYTTFLHKEPKFSIYKNDNQVASCVSEYENFITPKIKTTLMFEKNDISEILLCTIFSTLGFPNNDGLSKMFFEKKKFNNNWKPTN